jgi:hypothetical protein
LVKSVRLISTAIGVSLSKGIYLVLLTSKYRRGDDFFVRF